MKPLLNRAGIFVAATASPATQGKGHASQSQPNGWYMKENFMNSKAKHAAYIVHFPL